MCRWRWVNSDMANYDSSGEIAMRLRTAASSNACELRKSGAKSGRDACGALVGNRDDDAGGVTDARQVKAAGEVA